MPKNLQGTGDRELGTDYGLKHPHRRDARFCGRQGLVSSDSPHPQTSKNLAISLTIEAAEVLELFQWGETADQTELSSELADVLLYLLQIASLNDIDLGQAVLDKLKINDGREWEK